MAIPSFEEITQILLDYLVDIFAGLGLIESVIVLIFVMIIQAIIAPIISEAILTAAGGIFNEAFGTVGIYAAIFGGIVGSLLGAIAAFYIARWVQIQVKKRLIENYDVENVEITGDTWFQRFKSRIHIFLNKVSHFLARFIDEDSDDFIEIIEKRGFLIVLIGRILVFVPFDAISYAAGFTRIKFSDFMIATTIGTIPRVIFYVLLGTQLANAINTDFSLFVALFVGFAGGIFLLYKWLMSYLKNNQQKEVKDIEDENIETNPLPEETVS